MACTFRHFLWLLVVAHASALLAATRTPPVDPPTFEEAIRPIFRAHCYDCHGAADKREGNLDLRLRRLLVAGGDSGPAIVPGDSRHSLLFHRIRAGEMPPGDGKVSDAEIEVLRRWIDAGARTARPEPQQIGAGIGISAEERRFWSFQPIRRPPVPAFTAEDRVRTPIDALLKVALRDKGLSFSEDVDRRVLIRRAYFDLIGLPPTPDQVEAFVADRSPRAYQRLIDRLLDSPHYGERWARHWLDVAGYADSEGYTDSDAVRPYAYKYRDYVIRAFNADKPFDQFLREQLAGDELLRRPYKNLSPAERDVLAATGFLRMAVDGTGSGANNDDARNRVIADTIKIVSTSLLGLSVGCAQCHDHRYDPISQTDYYRFRSIFEPAYDWQSWRTPAERRLSLATEEDRAQAAAIERDVAKIAVEKAKQQAKYLTAALEKELANFTPSLRDELRDAYHTAATKRTAGQTQLLKAHPSVNITPGVLYQYNKQAADALKKFDARIAALRAKKPVEDFIRMLSEVPGHVPVTHVFHRGDYRQPRAAVRPAPLAIMVAPGEDVFFDTDDPSLPTTGRRLAYARWLTSGRHPLVARVLVNRVWMHHFGRGLVGTPSDFGRLGERPTHPQLLDWLADEFMASGWNLKRLHKLIMRSTVYRQSSRIDPRKAMVDPSNRLYWRKPIERLDAEVIRDRILAVSGRLSDQMFGPPTPVKPDETGQIVVRGSGRRRSLYVQVRRSQPVAMLKAFDAPVMETNCDRRPSSTVATQALMLMNSNFIVRQARAFSAHAVRDAGRLQAGNGVSATGTSRAPHTPWQNQVARAWYLAYGRPPDPRDVETAMRFLARQREFLARHPTSKKADPEREAFTNFCQVLIGSNEFLYVD